MRAIRAIQNIRSLWVSLVLAMGGSAATLLPSPAAAAAPEEVSSFSELTAQAQAHRAAERYAESAHAFAEAYEALGEDEQRGLKGEITIGNAVDDYRRAQLAEPDSVGLLFQEVALLERYGKRIDGLPEELSRELERARARVQDVHRMREDLEAEKRLEAERRRAEARLEAQRNEEPEPEPEPEPEGPPSTRRADLAILGVGVASVVGGTALLANGVWNIGKVDRRGAELLSAHDAYDSYSEQERVDYRAEVAVYQDRWSGIGRGLAIGGAVLVAAGVGLTTWGAIRLRRSGHPNRVRAKIPVPAVWTRGGGVSVSCWF